MVLAWIENASNPVEVLPTERAIADEVLLAVQVTTRSPMGALIYETGGLRIDHGWLTILGAGNQTFSASLLTWNTPSSSPLFEPPPGMLIVAYDAVGGFFAINGTAFPDKPGRVYYLAPDTLAWELVTESYSSFLLWALTGDLALFYAAFRWPGWEHEVAPLAANRGVSIYPPLWAQGGPVGERSRRPVPMQELWGLNTGGWQIEAP